MNLIFYSLFIGLVSCSDLSPDSLKFYHDLTSGHGLYSTFDKIISLNFLSFKDVVYSNTTQKSWIIEFYNSWCGHCHKFVPTWKSLAIDIYDWKDIVQVGAVDCSNSNNTPLCRNYEVMYYPTVKFFPKYSPSTFLGTPINNRTVESLRHAIIDNLRKTPEGEQLKPFEHKIEDIWNPKHIKHALVVVEDNSSYIGSELALDVMYSDNLRVVSMLPTNEAVDSLHVSSIPAIYLLGQNTSCELVQIANFNRADILKAVGLVLTPKGYSVPLPPDFSHVDNHSVDIPQAFALMQVEEQIKSKLNSKEISDMVFQVDIEGALKQSLFIEISSHKNISGESYRALQNYITVLIKYFPIGKKGMLFLNCVKQGVDNNAQIGGQYFYNLSESCEKKFNGVFLNSKERWLGCKGSRTTYRGYPCALWTMFHTLTVQSDIKQANDSRELLNAMTGYIKHFFGCTACSKHFQEMAVTMAGNVSNTEESILWLWKAHNSVNKRLKGDYSEDPLHPKVQFPPEKVCKKCSTAEVWDEGKVLEFLKRMYTNISYIIIEDVAQPKEETAQTPVPDRALRSEVIVDEKFFSVTKMENGKTTVFLWDFNTFDVSLCVILYLFSMAIIVLVCFKFYRKTYRKKPYLYDVFQKV